MRQTDTILMRSPDHVPLITATFTVVFHQADANTAEDVPAIMIAMSAACALTASATTTILCNYAQI